jgi:hypothetical protein
MFDRVFRHLTECIVAKAALMFIIAIVIPNDPILTIGNSTASFLEVLDPITRGTCLGSLKNFQNKDLWPSAKPWTDTKSRWKDVTSSRRRTIIIAI